MFCTSLRSRPFRTIVPGLQSSLSLRESHLKSHDVFLVNTPVLLLHPSDLHPASVDAVRDRLEHLAALSTTSIVIVVTEGDVAPIMQAQELLMPHLDTVSMRLAHEIGDVPSVLQQCSSRGIERSSSSLRALPCPEMASVLPVSPDEASIVKQVFSSLQDLGRGCLVWANGLQYHGAEESELWEKMETLRDVLGERVVEGFVSFWMGAAS